MIHTILGGVNMRRVIYVLVIFFSFSTLLLANEEIDNFVKRLYENILQRDADSSGLRFWSNELENSKSALYVAKKFFFSKEFKEKDISDEEFIRICYKTFLNREPDKEGESYWLNQMKQNGVPKTQVFYNFVFSDEFKNLAKQAGIVYATEDDKLKAFIERFYNYILKRDAGEREVSYWVDSLKNGSKKVEDIVRFFFFSKEFLSENVSDEEFVKRAFKTILNRNPDKNGFDFWVNKLKTGEMTREKILNEFIKSEEFLALKKEYLPDSGNFDETLPINDNYQLLAYNDLGMHCMDDDYSVFSILPPYNTLVAQLIKKEEGDAKRITSGVEITYESAKSLTGVWNTTSKNKTNFWDYVYKLFNTELSPDIGLKGNPTPSKKPAKMRYDKNHDWWVAEGIPIVPKDDDGRVDYYPLVKVTAKDKNGNILAQTITVLPVSDEMNCKKCHSSNSNYLDAKPLKGWVNDPNPSKDYRYNILRLHDQKHNISSYLTKLQSKGYNYKSSLEETARGGTPILCAACHKSNALSMDGFSSLPSLSQAIHDEHKNVKDPSNGLLLNDIENRNACYACHPGSFTQCLRGAMGSAKDQNGKNIMECQSCHGTMSAVGKEGRDAWLDEPTCQNCHQNSKRYTTAVVDKFSGTLRDFLDKRFATNPDTPVKGKSLYRFSKGHGGVSCSACHGSTHAIYKSSKPEDNLQSISAQGHAGTIAECTACHKSVPKTVNKGPHGMHTVGEEWIKMHKEVAEDNGAESCKACHGADFKGSFLSETFSKRVFRVEDKTKTFPKGYKISCYDCHNGPNGEEDEEEDED